MRTSIICGDLIDGGHIIGGGGFLQMGGHLQDGGHIDTPIDGQCAVQVSL